MSTPSPASFPAPKPHYAALDGLRGVAAVMVVLFHMFEGSARDLQFHTDQIINHGYLSVDFFFMLSGFVIGYAYDDRWGNMTLWNFCKRRLVRLQPMVVMGMLLGGILFSFQGSEIFPNLEQTPVWKMLLVMTVGFTLLPVPVSLDVRGWSEMHPLNGPAWSLFFEYVANILYAVLIRKFTSRWLAVLVFLAGCALIHQCYTQGNNIGGWTLDAEQCRVGLTRLMFPFFGGLLIVIFPAGVFLGASDIPGDISARASRFLGNISYPLYITHYPIVYLYLAWVHDAEVPLSRALPVAAGVLLLCIAVAYGCLKLYDEPVRAWLSKRVLKRRPPEPGA